MLIYEKKQKERNKILKEIKKVVCNRVLIEN